MFHSDWPQECLDLPLGSQDLGRTHGYLEDHRLLWTSWTIQGPSGSHGAYQVSSEWSPLRSFICTCDYGLLEAKFFSATSGPQLGQKHGFHCLIKLNQP